MSVAQSCMKSAVSSQPSSAASYLNKAPISHIISHRRDRGKGKGGNLVTGGIEKDTQSCSVLVTSAEMHFCTSQLVVCALELLMV